MSVQQRCFSLHFLKPLIRNLLNLIHVLDKGKPKTSEMFTKLGIEHVKLFSNLALNKIRYQTNEISKNGNYRVLRNDGTRHTDTRSSNKSVLFDEIEAV